MISTKRGLYDWGATHMTGLGEEYAEIAAINSELRYITLELMKIAASQNKPFESVLKEFTANSFKLKRTVMRGPTAQKPRRIKTIRSHL